MGVIISLGCNSGKANYKENMATALLKNLNTNKVIAADGMIMHEKSWGNYKLYVSSNNKKGTQGDGSLVLCENVNSTAEPSPCVTLVSTFENPNEAPFAYIQEVAVSDYMVLDETTGEILKLECYPEYSGKGAMNDGKAVVNLSIDNAKLKSGEEYTIVIEKMYGLAKADAPLHITGTWECKFVK